MLAKATSRGSVKFTRGPRSHEDSGSAPSDTDDKKDIVGDVGFIGLAFRY